MPALFFVLFIACVIGLIRPFTGLKRWHFGIAAFVSFLLIGVTAPKTQSGSSRNGIGSESRVSPAEAAAMEKRNAAQIAALKARAAKLSSTDLDGNVEVYKQLAALAPANSIYAEKVSFFQGKIDAAERYRDNPEQALKVDDFRWSAGGFGSVMVIDRLTVSNAAPFSIKDFTLHCVHQGNSGTDIDENTRTVFEIVPANGKKTIRNINMGFIASQVASSSCEITGAKIVG